MARPRGAEPTGAEPTGAEPAGAEPTGAEPAGAQAASADRPETFAGEDLGRPRRGSGSVASLSHRIAAFAIDAVIADGITYGLFRHLQPYSLPVIFALYVVSTSLVSRTPGMAAVGLRIATVDGRRFSVGQALVRTFLLCLLIPALFTDHNVRGLHDRAAGAIVVRR
jgi:uncharacterized RDD family membrane protein YckC